MEIENANQIYAALMRRGLSCRAWALREGYNPRTVQKCVQMFAPDTGVKPRWGKVSKEILVELSNEIEFDLVGQKYD
ncbi:helix-turn-helix domain-containing protein [Shewanella glacialimarina]|uniref:hypothetical protein n=1 Tax=Shewanella glacialimarina TaxID=2590884 RepID=UPI001CF80660|nr:hypothetical protein [Shewanella glacialimarina]UCX05455.1 hypothetical protein FJ709_13750 [Shewanella glacialimarina]